VESGRSIRSAIDGLARPIAHIRMTCAGRNLLVRRARATVGVTFYLEFQQSSVSLEGRLTDVGMKGIVL
jgi:hypothetical protein